MKKRTNKKHKTRDLLKRVKLALSEPVAAKPHPLEFADTDNPLEGIRKIQKYLDELDKPEIEKYGAPLRDFMFAFPAFRDDDGNLMVYLKFGKAYYQSLELWDCHLSEWVDGIYRIRKPEPFTSIFDGQDFPLSYRSQGFNRYGRY